MAKTFKTEKQCHRAVMAYLKTLRPEGRFIKVAQGYYSEAGISDIMGCYKGTPIALELKSATGKPSPKQIRFLKDFMAAGGIADVIRTVEQVKIIIEDIDNERT